MVLHGSFCSATFRVAAIRSLRNVTKFGHRASRSSPRWYSIRTKVARARGPPVHKTAPTSPAPNVYPERLLVYHAGSPTISFVAVSKLTAIFVFLGATAYFGPVFYLHPSEINWAVVSALNIFTVCIASTIPLIVMVYSIPPMITYVHMELPSLARVSKDRLLRFTQHLPETTKLDVTSLRWVWPRITRLRVSELQILQAQGGQAKIGRLVPKEVLETRKWWMWRPETRFQVYKKSVKTPVPEIWEVILNHLKNRPIPYVGGASSAVSKFNGRPRDLLQGLKKGS